MVEPPDDEAIKRLVEAASEIDLLPEVLAQVPGAVERVNALRRSWIANGNMREDSQTNDDLGVVTLAATWAENGLIAARVRAEAVADERQRIVEAIDAVRVEYEALGVDRMWSGGMKRAVTIVGAGSVPVATPEAHDTGCERAYGQGDCFCQRRADVDFSHTVPRPVVTPLAVEARLMNLEQPSPEEAEERGIGGLLATFDVPAGLKWGDNRCVIVLPAPVATPTEPRTADAWSWGGVDTTPTASPVQPEESDGAAAE